MTNFIRTLPWIFICLSLAYTVFRYEKNNNIAKEYYIMEGMTFYLIIGTILAIVFNLKVFLISTGSLLFGLVLGSILKKDRYY